MIEFLVAEFPPEWRKLSDETFWRKVTPLLQIYVSNGMTRPIPSHVEWVAIDWFTYDNCAVVVVNMEETGDEN